MLRLKGKFFLGIVLFLCVSISAEAKRAKSVKCAIPKALASEVSSLFRLPIAYTQMNIALVSYKDNHESLNALAEKEVKFAIVRSDILYALTQGIYVWPKLKTSYITLSTLPWVSHLYYVQNVTRNDIDLVHLKEKLISVGLVGEANGYLLKGLLRLYGLRHSIQYKSLNYPTSLRAIDNNTLDGYFGFLPDTLENEKYHFQRLFSEESLQYIIEQNIYHVDYEGVSISYTLVASKDATDEEIENMIYRLEEKKMFAPQTDEKFGPVNLYVLEHLAQIQKALDAQVVDRETESAHATVLSQRCLDYHYGFLDILRRKPALKKRVHLLSRKNSKSYKIAKKNLKKIENILLNIDAKKQQCDLHYLKNMKNMFLSISNKINHF